MKRQYLPAKRPGNSRLVITRSDERVFHIGDDISIHVTTNQWGHTKLTIDAPRSGLANKYGADILAGAVAADYRKLRKLSDKDSAIHFAHENDYRWLTQWLAERDQPPIGKTCPKNWSTAPCRTP